MSLFNFLKCLPSFTKTLPQSLQFYPKAKAKLDRAQMISRETIRVLK